VPRQIERLGFRREDVRHIVITHFDFDHIGGLVDFPDNHARLAELYARGEPDLLLVCAHDAEMYENARAARRKTAKPEQHAANSD
jgi:glyoxylase-like metal-dependent hydrolase (beta-lactamase superfamily II)